MANVHLSALHTIIKDLSISNELSPENLKKIDLIAGHLKELSQITWKAADPRLKAKIFERAFLLDPQDELSRWIDQQMVHYLLNSEVKGLPEFTSRVCSRLENDTLTITRGSSLTDEDVQKVLNETLEKQRIKKIVFSDLSKMTKIPELRSFEQLESLEIKACNSLIDLTGLPSSITSLKIQSCQKLSDLSSIQVEKLNALSLTYCFMLKNFASLKALQHLKTLDLSGCPSFRDLSLLSENKELETLILNDLPHLKSLEPLESFTKLHSISAKRSGVPSAGSLSLRSGLSIDL